MRWCVSATGQTISSWRSSTTDRASRTARAAVTDSRACASGCVSTEASSTRDSNPRAGMPYAPGCRSGAMVTTASARFFAYFEGPTDAVRCAAAISDSIERLGLAVRIGLHTGECELIGAKLGGIAVHVGARIAGEAGTGEILVSSTV